MPTVSRTLTEVLTVTGTVMLGLKFLPAIVRLTSPSRSAVFEAPANTAAAVLLAAAVVAFAAAAVLAAAAVFRARVAATVAMLGWRPAATARW